MKLKRNKSSVMKKSSTTKKSNSGVGALPSYAVTDQGEMKKQQDAHDAKTNIVKFIPEFYLNDGDEKTIRILNPQGSLAMIYVYVLPYRVGKKKFFSFTRPAKEEDDRYNAYREDVDSEKFYDAQPRFIYEILDVNGYVKDGKRMTNLVRFWIVSGKVNKQLMAIKKRYGDMTKYPIDIERVGTGQATTYNFFGGKEEALPSINSKERLNTRFDEFFAPLPPEKQDIILASI